MQQQIGDIDAYLRSLEMRIIFNPFDRTTRVRVAQLINKSNQFNLTTRRYTEAEVAAAEADPDALTLHARLIDKFGDNGIISIVICRRMEPAVWTIDTWLMSCRVLGRGVEKMVLREILFRARARGIRSLIGIYLPTEKNGMVREHYGKLGFTLVSEDASGSSKWELSTDTEVEEAPMTVDRDTNQMVELA